MLWIQNHDYPDKNAFSEFHSRKQTKFKTTRAAIEQIISPYLIGDGHQTALESFSALLLRHGKKLILCDTATGGLLESLLKTPETQHLLQFTTTENAADVSIQGLQDFWQGKEAVQKELKLTFSASAKPRQIVKNIPFRNARVRYWATEYICLELGRWLES